MLYDNILSYAIYFCVAGNNAAGNIDCCNVASNCLCSVLMAYKWSSRSNNVVTTNNVAQLLRKIYDLT